MIVSISTAEKCIISQARKIYMVLYPKELNGSGVNAALCFGKEER